MKNTNNNGGILNLNINLLCNEYNNTTSLMGENNNDSQSSLDYSKDYSINSIEESSFIVTKKKKRKPKDEMKYVENSPNGKFSRTDQKSYSEKYHISYSGIDNDRGCKIIWHELNVSSLDEEKTENLFNELQRLKTISKEDCLNTITEVWLREDKRVIVFITDCFGMGTLRQYLTKIGKQKLKVIKGWICILLRSLTFLHMGNLVFGDLNSSRILFNGITGNLAIKDLFVASDVFYKSYNEKPYEIFAPNYMCPELITQLKVNEKSDVYSLAMVIIEVITLEIPYADVASDKEIMGKIGRGELPQVFNRIMDENVKKFLLKMLAYEPEKRASIEDLLNDDFLKIGKEDFQIVKVKSGRYKKLKNRLNYQQEDFNFKNFIVSKDFKEDPYNGDDIENIKTNDQRIFFDDNDDNNRNIKSSKGKQETIEKEVKEYENLAAKSDSDDDEEIALNHNGVYDNSYHIVDDDYNVHLKILINEEGKVNEIQFTYNLLKDSIDSLMEEIKSEFNLNHDNLNHIYETLKKVHIYSKLCKDLELLPNNSF